MYAEVFGNDSPLPTVLGGDFVITDKFLQVDNWFLQGIHCL